jgi:hypothetical protein
MSAVLQATEVDVLLWIMPKTLATATVDGLLHHAHVVA